MYTLPSPESRPSVAHLVDRQERCCGAGPFANIFHFHWRSNEEGVKVPRRHPIWQAIRVSGVTRCTRFLTGVRSTHGQDGAIVLDVRQGQMFNLNFVGSRILELLKAGSTESRDCRPIGRRVRRQPEMCRERRTGIHRDVEEVPPGRRTRTGCDRLSWNQDHANRHNSGFRDAIVPQGGHACWRCG